MEILCATPDDRLQLLFDRAKPGDVIRLSPGVYRQKAVLRTPGITLRGCGAEKTRIVYSDYARKKDPEGFDYITFRSYTLAVCADDVTIEELSILNDAGAPETKGQQVALSVLGSGFRMERCHLSSTQDTLFCGPLPPDLIERYEGFLPDELRRSGSMEQVFTHCRIEGTVDFIFGCGSALFDSCELRSRRDARGIGYAAAPAHSPEQETGFRFLRCRFTREEGVADRSVFLARPWRDYGACLFQDCSYGPHIAPEGFDKWAGTCRDQTARFWESPSVPGRVPWVSRITL